MGGGGGNIFQTSNEYTFQIDALDNKCFALVSTIKLFKHDDIDSLDEYTSKTTQWRQRWMRPLSEVFLR